MSDYSPKPNPEHFREHEDYLKAKQQWDREDRKADLERYQAAREVSASRWFQKLSLFIAHVVFFAMLCVLIFSERHRSDFLTTIADPNPLWSIAKGIGYILLLYMICLFVSPIIVWLTIGGIMIGILMLFLGML
jgi:hypothetical protein